MFARSVALALCLVAVDIGLAMSYIFRTQVSGHLGGPIKFEFRDDVTKRQKTNIEEFAVSVRTPHQRWKAIWSIGEGRRVTQPIEYGVTPPGFTTQILPQQLVSGRIYGAFASDGHGGSAGILFRFRKDGTITFPESSD